MNKNTLESDFDVVSTKDIDLISRYLKKAAYIESNHNLVNMMIWLDYYPLFKHVEPNYLLLLGIHEKEFFVYMPLCEKEYVPEALLKAKEIFDRYQCPFNLSCFTKELMDVALDIFKGYHACSKRSSADYIYTTDQFRTFSGKKLQKKRNHLNAFYKLYEGRFVYEDLNASNCEECLAVLKKWIKEEEKWHGENKMVAYEVKGIERVLSLYNELSFDGGLIRIDGQVEGFIIASRMTIDTCQENVEKANDNIRGIYQALIHQFFTHNYEDIRYVNREDDLGLDHLRQAKLAYQPIQLLDKYWLCKED